jgi:hypothetical protein
MIHGKSTRQFVFSPCGPTGAGKRAVWLRVCFDGILGNEVAARLPKVAARRTSPRRAIVLEHHAPTIPRTKKKKKTKTKQNDDEEKMKRKKSMLARNGDLLNLLHHMPFFLLSLLNTRSWRQARPCMPAHTPAALAAALRDRTQPQCGIRRRCQSQECRWGCPSRETSGCGKHAHIGCC